MFLADLINNLVPKYYSQVDQLRAFTIIATSFAVGVAIFLLIFYWVVTKSFETKNTLFVALIIIFLLAACVGFVMRGHLITGAWMLIILMILMNFSNMVLYGISSSASAAYIIPILLAMLCIGTNTGFGVAVIGCMLVFIIPILQSRGKLKSILPFNVSSLTFDAPVLTFVYILVTVISYTWAS